MIIADKLKKKNRAEYLIYMWQVEDLLRAYGLDAERISAEYVSRFTLPESQRRQMQEWYTDLCEMMRSEGKKETGHLQICRNILQELEELHARLLKSPKFPYYKEMYYKVLPYIVELRAKRKNARTEMTGEISELETCLDFLYGVMLLKVQKKEVSAGTEKAVKDISVLFGQLSDYYFKDKENPIEF